MKDAKPNLIQFTKKGPVIFEIKCPYCGKLRYWTTERFFESYEKQGPEWGCDSCLTVYRVPEEREMRAQHKQVWEGEGDVS